MPFIFLPVFILVEELVQVAVTAAVVTVGVRAAAQATHTAVDTVHNWSTSSASTTTYVEQKTIWDWWGNGLEGWQRDYLLELGYSDRSATYSLHQLKHITKHRERELLTQESQVYIQQWIDETGYSSSEERRRNERVVNCSKKDSPVWKGKKHHKGDIRTNGKTGSDRRYYRWDNTHNDIEVYNHRGKHLGSMDSRNGRMYKGPVSTNSISHLL